MQLEFKDGVHEISNADYHASKGISRSGIMQYKISPYHYYQRYLSGEHESHTTPEMLKGELVHAFVLEREQFGGRYYIQQSLPALPKVGLLKDLGRDEYDKQKAEYESARIEQAEFKKKQEAESAGKTVISESMFNEVLELTEAVNAHEYAKFLFKNPAMQAEKSIYFTHTESGLQCKVRPDAWINGIVVDLKTAKDASYNAFQRAAYFSGYFMQAAMTRYAFRKIGQDFEKFIFFAIEKETKATAVYSVDDNALDMAEDVYTETMVKMAESFEKNEWPSYPDSELIYPAYSKYND